MDERCSAYKRSQAMWSAEGHVEGHAGVGWECSVGLKCRTGLWQKLSSHQRHLCSPALCHPSQRTRQPPME
eukprot:1305776-Amphidinium_carterae.1